MEGYEEENLSQLGPSLTRLHSPTKMEDQESFYMDQANLNLLKITLEDIQEQEVFEPSDANFIVRSLKSVEPSVDLYNLFGQVHDELLTSLEVYPWWVGSADHWDLYEIALEWDRLVEQEDEPSMEEVPEPEAKDESQGEVLLSVLDDLKMEDSRPFNTDQSDLNLLETTLEDIQEYEMFEPLDVNLIIRSLKIVEPSGHLYDLFGQVHDELLSSLEVYTWWVGSADHWDLYEIALEWDRLVAQKDESSMEKVPEPEDQDESQEEVLLSVVDGLKDVLEPLDVFAMVESLVSLTPTLELLTTFNLVCQTMEEKLSDHPCWKDSINQFNLRELSLEWNKLQPHKVHQAMKGASATCDRPHPLEVHQTMERMSITVSLNIHGSPDVSNQGSPRSTSPYRLDFTEVCLDDDFSEDESFDSFTSSSGEDRSKENFSNNGSSPDQKEDTRLHSTTKMEDSRPFNIDQSDLNLLETTLEDIQEYEMFGPLDANLIIRSLRTIKPTVDLYDLFGQVHDKLLVSLEVYTWWVGSADHWDLYEIGLEWDRLVNQEDEPRMEEVPEAQDESQEEVLLSVLDDLKQAFLEPLDVFAMVESLIPLTPTSELLTQFNIVCQTMQNTLSNYTWWKDSINQLNLRELSLEWNKLQPHEVHQAMEGASTNCDRPQYHEVHQAMEGASTPCDSPHSLEVHQTMERACSTLSFKIQGSPDVSNQGSPRSTSPYRLDFTEVCLDDDFSEDECFDSFTSSSGEDMSKENFANNGSSPEHANSLGEVNQQVQVVMLTQCDQGSLPKEPQGGVARVYSLPTNKTTPQGGAARACSLPTNKTTPQGGAARACSLPTNKTHPQGGVARACSLPTNKTHPQGGAARVYSLPTNKTTPQGGAARACSLPTNQTTPQGGVARVYSLPTNNTTPQGGVARVYSLPTNNTTPQGGVARVYSLPTNKITPQGGAARACSLPTNKTHPQGGAAPHQQNITPSGWGSQNSALFPPTPSINPQQQDGVDTAHVIASGITSTPQPNTGQPIGPQVSNHNQGLTETDDQDPSYSLNFGLSSDLLTLAGMKWPEGFEINLQDATAVEFGHIKNSVMNFDGENIDYPAFKRFFVGQVHNNHKLTTYQRSYLLEQMLGHEPSSLVCPKGTSNVQGYQKMLFDLDRFYSVGTQDAFRNKIMGLEECNPKELNTLQKIIEVLKKANSEFGAKSSVLMGEALKKVGRLASYFIINHPNVWHQDLNTLCEFLIQQYALKKKLGFNREAKDWKSRFKLKKASWFGCLDRPPEERSGTSNKTLVKETSTTVNGSMYGTSSSASAYGSSRDRTSTISTQK